MPDHGSFYWNELLTSDAPAAVAFFERVAGWKAEPMEMPEGTYHVMMLNGRPAGGIMGATPDMPAESIGHWMSYLAVDDVDASCGTISSAGGVVCRAPWDVPGVGRIAIVADPTGAVLGIITPVPMPG